MLRSAGIFLHLLQWRSVFSLRKTTTKRGSKEGRMFLGMKAPALRGVRRLLLFIFGHLCVHTSSEHDPSHHGHPTERWLQQLGDTSRSTQTLGLIIITLA